LHENVWSAAWVLISDKGARQQRKKALNDGGLELAARSLRAFPLHDGVQRYAKLFLGMVLQSFQQKALKRAGPVELMAIMAAYEGDPELVQEACAAVAAFVASSDSAQHKLLVQEGGVEAVVGAMRRPAFATAAGVQKHCASALAHLATIHDDASITRPAADEGMADPYPGEGWAAGHQQAIRRSGALEAVLAALGNLPADSEVQWYGCNAIGNLCAHDAESWRQLTDGGAIPRTLSVSLPLKTAAALCVCALRHRAGHLPAAVGEVGIHRAAAASGRGRLREVLWLL
jgi:hypothetical protein